MEYDENRKALFPRVSIYPRTDKQINKYRSHNFFLHKNSKTKIIFFLAY